MTFDVTGPYKTLYSNSDLHKIRHHRIQVYFYKGVNFISLTSGYVYPKELQMSVACLLNIRKRLFYKHIIYIYDRL
jgi:hypothetical protein